MLESIGMVIMVAVGLILWPEILVVMLLFMLGYPLAAIVAIFFAIWRFLE